jgi:hypothetical protein
MDKFVEIKEATRHALKHSEYRSSSVDARQTPRVKHMEFIVSIDHILIYSSPSLTGQYIPMDLNYQTRIN